MPRRFHETSEVAKMLPASCSAKMHCSYITSTDLSVDNGCTSMTAEVFGDKLSFAVTVY